MLLLRTHSFGRVRVLYCTGPMWLESLQSRVGLLKLQQWVTVAHVLPFEQLRCKEQKLGCNKAVHTGRIRICKCGLGSTNPAWLESILFPKLDPKRDSKRDSQSTSRGSFRRYADVLRTAVASGRGQMRTVPNLSSKALVML